jgi:hypothetical protein
MAYDTDTNNNGACESSPIVILLSEIHAYSDWIRKARVNVFLTIDYANHRDRAS